MACGAFLRALLERGLRVAEGLLVVIDGRKGLRRAVLGHPPTTRSV
jgi:hypothetical protein